MRHDSVPIENRSIATPELIWARLHASVRGVHLLEIHRLQELQRAPTVIHEDFHVQGSIVVAVHRETTRLCQGVDDGWVSVKDPISLHTAKTECTGGFESVTVQQNLV